MKPFNPPFDLNEDELQRLYQRHKRHGLASDMDFPTFKTELSAQLSDPLTVLFSILPKAPHLAESFYNTLSDDEFDLVSGLATLTGYVPLDFPIELNPAVSPDLRLEERYGLPFLTSFDKNNLDIVQFTQDAVHFYWQNFDVINLQALDDTEQLCLLRYLDILSNPLGKYDQAQHLKLVFGLHIPQSYKNFHQDRIDELMTRILTSPVYAGIFESIFEKDNCAENNLPYLTGAKDKDIFCNILMQDLAQIWGIPTPIRKDFDETKKDDAKGAKFIPIMHAYYLSRGDKDHAPGLYYGFNIKTGIMDKQDYYDLKAMAHEFAHLISIHITRGHKNQQLMRSHSGLQKAPILSLSAVSAAFEANSPQSRYPRYYPQIGTDFTGLPKPDGKAEYKGQIEERHADWLGEAISEAVRFALLSRKTIRNFAQMQEEIVEQFKPIFKNLKLASKAPELTSFIQLNILEAPDMPALKMAVRGAFSALNDWYKNNVNEHYERDFALNNSKTLTRHIKAPNLLARQQMRELSRLTEKLFHCYDLYARQAGLEKNPVHAPLPLDENGLSQSP